jgi:hypothetical protein
MDSTQAARHHQTIGPCDPLIVIAAAVTSAALAIEEDCFRPPRKIELGETYARYVVDVKRLIQHIVILPAWCWPEQPTRSTGAPGLAIFQTWVLSAQ